MTPEEMKLCGKYISDLFTATQNKALPVHKRMPAFFRTIGPEHIWDWIAMHRAEQAAAANANAVEADEPFKTTIRGAA